MRFPVISLLQRLALTGLLGLAVNQAAHAAPNASGAPDQFVQQVADETLNALKAGGGVKAGDTARVNQVVTQQILPYVDFEKTTRLSAGRNWRQATPAQQKALAEAFRGTLVRTYAGALTRVDNQTTVKTLPFRGDAKADDVVVRTSISQSNGQNTGVDYRLEKTASGWKIYDLNVEGIWLIQNYRNQFTQQINQSGIDGLIKALNQRNQ
jgi:phospholipid transport system substrate-binding protein